MQVDRRRVVAVALDLLDRTAEADAVLQDVPDAAAIRAEFAWKRQDWARVVAETDSSLPTGPLGKIGQVVILRRAIALAMLRNEAALAELHARYQGAFSRLPSGPVFAVINPAGAQSGSTIASKALETSTADIATEFTNMIRFQRAYSASSKIITTVDQMLQELNELKR